MIDIGIQHADQTGQGIVIAAKETAALIVEYLEKQKLKSSAPKPKNPVTGNYYFNKCFMIYFMICHVILNMPKASTNSLAMFNNLDHVKLVLGHVQDQLTCPGSPPTPWTCSVVLNMCKESQYNSSQ